VVAIARIFPQAFYMEERELLGLANGQWITTLEYAFQDEEYLYLVMEYLAGGNLLNLMYKQTLDIDAVRFYIAEAVLGVREVHRLGFAYRCDTNAIGELWRRIPTHSANTVPGAPRCSITSHSPPGTSSQIT